MRNRPPDRISDYDAKYWYDNDKDKKLHNDFGFPAVIYCVGTKYWCNHGKFHNDYGPAIIWSDGTKLWYINGVEYSEEEFKQFKIKNFIDNEK